MTDERRTFLAAMAEFMFFGAPGVGTPWPQPEEGGANYAKALRRFTGRGRPGWSHHRHGPSIVIRSGFDCEFIDNRASGRSVSLSAVS